MEQPSRGALERGRGFLTRRRARLSRLIQRSLTPPPPSGDLPEDRRRFLLEEGQELYWNELSWEEITDEERIAGGHLTELVFPGFLAFVDALLFHSSAGEPAHAHPEIVEQILAFLGSRYVEVTSDLEQGADSERLVWARSMTAHLIDLVLYRLYALSRSEREALEHRA